MNGKRDLFISAVIHKVYGDMNEEKTEAMATSCANTSTVRALTNPSV
ncbi:MAG: hypothetical protein ACUZ77_07475 [Candidatus Brocadiales bacterium]